LNIPVKSLGASGLGFGKAIFNTAMSWRDSMQSALPGYRNRIAQVRTSAGEGGTNIFMPREIIASLALRGALAWVRLRTRFIDDQHWNRFRWLRLRIAMSNMERLRAGTFERRGFYADAFSGEAWLQPPGPSRIVGTSVADICVAPEYGGLYVRFCRPDQPHSRHHASRDLPRT
jgi:hypothetical protein